MPAYLPDHGAPIAPHGERPVQASHEDGADRPRYTIVWEGLQRGLHSFARVNREICLRLIERGHELSFLSPETHDKHSDTFPGKDASFPPSLRASRDAVLAHVRHEWPPNFTPPRSGHWILMQPWEYGSLPRDWVGPNTEKIDEFWAYSRFVRDCYIKSGISADRVHVVPLGVDTSRFHSQVQPLPLGTSKTFKFLFVGGAIHRKGIDILLQSYARAFTASDPVSLVIKDVRSASFYRTSEVRNQIDVVRAQSGAPEILYLDQELTAADVARLYTACDCLVHPYRGEGFGLPIAEAMASELPVIVTGSGAAPDYCSEDHAYLVPARIMRFRHQRIGELETVDYPWLAEADQTVLADRMRHVVDHPHEARAKGRAAGAHIRGRFTWDHTLDVIEARLEQLGQQPIRRFTVPRGKVPGSPDPSSEPAPSHITPVTAKPTSRPRVSLCMIVKNEEAHLSACLESVADLVDEMVVVDTGSTDATAAVASRRGARVHSFEWIDSFAAVRNESLRHAQGDWIFWLDADEMLDEENRLKLRSLLAGLSDENAAYVMRQRSPASTGATAAIVADQVRLFRRLPEVHWSYRVHEQILPALRRTGVDLRRSDIVIQHSGHEDLAVRRRKLDRDLRLLLLENKERPDDPFTLFNLGSLYHETGRPAEALPLLQRSLERSRPRASIVTKLHALITGCLRQLQRPQEALDACQAGLKHTPDDDELLFLNALIQRELGDAAGAKATLIQLLCAPRVASLANGDDALRGYKARHNLAVIYEETGRPAEAEAQWRAAVIENPHFSTGWLRLGELYLKQERWDDLEAAAGGLSGCPSGPAKAIALRRAARPCATRRQTQFPP